MDRLWRTFWFGLHRLGLSIVILQVPAHNDKNKLKAQHNISDPILNIILSQLSFELYIQSRSTHS